jgi:hypothetical protein
VGAQDPALVDGPGDIGGGAPGDTLPDRPARVPRRIAIVLGLDADKRADHVLGAAEWLARDALGVDPAMEDVPCIHASSIEHGGTANGSLFLQSNQSGGEQRPDLYAAVDVVRLGEQGDRARDHDLTPARQPGQASACCNVILHSWRGRMGIG